MSWWQTVAVIFVPVAILLVLGVPMAYIMIRIQERRLLNKRQSLTVVREPMEQSTIPELPKRIEAIAPELLTEIEANYRIASDPHKGEMLLFQTSVWNSIKQHALGSLADLREELVQAYIDIGLANNIVSMATELKFRSPNLDEQYVKLCAKIVARLDSAKRAIALDSTDT